MIGLLAIMMFGAPGASDALADAVRAQLGLGPDADVKVSEVHTGDPDAARGELVRVELSPGARPTGRVAARATYRLGGAKGGTRETWLSARVDVRVPMVVATHALERGAIIGEGDVALQLAALDADGLRDRAAAIGARVRATVASGEALRSWGLERPQLVARGDRVEATVRGETFSLTAPAEALANGGLGEAVSVRVLVSGKVLRGTIAGPGRVEVTP